MSCFPTSSLCRSWSFCPPSLSTSSRALSSSVQYFSWLRLRRQDGEASGPGETSVHLPCLCFYLSLPACRYICKQVRAKGHVRYTSGDVSTSTQPLVAVCGPDDSHHIILLLPDLHTLLVLVFCPAIPHMHPLQDCLPAWPLHIPDPLPHSAFLADCCYPPSLLPDMK